MGGGRVRIERGYAHIYTGTRYGKTGKPILYSTRYDSNITLKNITLTVRIIVTFSHPNVAKTQTHT